MPINHLQWRWTFPRIKISTFTYIVNVHFIFWYLTIQKLGYVLQSAASQNEFAVLFLGFQALPAPLHQGDVKAWRHICTKFCISQAHQWLTSPPPTNMLELRHMHFKWQGRK
jgi:hypothetical protein